MSSEGPLRDGLGPGDRLIETLRFAPGEEFVRLDRHLARMARSAEALGFAYSRKDVMASLADLQTATTPLRVRLTLSRDGRVETVAQPFASLPAEAVWSLRIAAARLDSADPLLRHKTTRRDVYERARGEFSTGDAHEVLLLNERGEVCEGTITSVFLDAGDEGPLRTPPLSCGLLAGVLRGELLERGDAVEAVLRPTDLANAEGLFVGNSLRGLIPARLAVAHAGGNNA